MQFNDTTNRSGLIQDCEDLCQLGATGISSNTSLLKQFTRWINQEYHKVVTIILASQDDWDFDDTNKTDYPVATTPLVASQRDYTFPASLKILKIKRVDVTYDGTNWHKAEIFDSSEATVPMGNDSKTDEYFEKTAPKCDIRANAMWLYPRASADDVAAGAKMRVEFFREPTEFTISDTTAEPGFDEPFHPMLSIGASIKYGSIYGLANLPALVALYNDYESRLREYYGKKNEARELMLNSVYSSTYGK